MIRDYFLENYPDLRWKQIERYDIFLSECGIAHQDIRNNISLLIKKRTPKKEKDSETRFEEYYERMCDELFKNAKNVFDQDFEKATFNDYFNPFFLAEELTECQAFQLRQKDLESKNFKILEIALLYIGNQRTIEDFIVNNGAESLDLEYILGNQHLPWDWWRISFRKDLTLEIINSHPKLSWDMEQFCRTHKVTLKDYLKFKHLINWDMFQYYGEINVEDILAHPELDWNFNILSSRFSLKQILNHLHFPWNYGAIQINTHIDDVLAYPGIDWNYTKIHLCKGFNILYFLKYPQLQQGLISAAHSFKSSYSVHKKLIKTFPHLRETVLGLGYLHEHFIFIKSIYAQEIKVKEILDLDF